MTADDCTCFLLCFNFPAAQDKSVSNDFPHEVVSTQWSVKNVHMKKQKDDFVGLF